MVWLAWWAWALLGVGLAIVEVLVPSYIALGFAMGAGLVGLGLLVGVLPFGIGGLLILFGVLSGLAWFVLRQVFGPVGGGVQTFDKDIND